MFKKVLAGLLSATLAVSMLSGCGSSPAPSSSAAPSGEGEEKVKVAFLTATGGLGDRGFNDATWAAFQEAEQTYGVEIKVVENQSPADYRTSITTVADAGYDFVLVLGNDWGDTLSEVAPKYPDIKFAGINLSSEGPNIAIGRYGDHEGSFLVGSLAALMTENGTVGFVGGVDNPNIRRFLVGYEEGAKYVNPDVKVLSTFVGSFNDPGKGKEFALSIFNQGADVIFAAAGLSGEGVFEAAKENEKLYAIGVDQDQDDRVPGKVLTSMVKNTRAIVMDNIEAVVNGTFEPGMKIYGLKEGGVGITEMQYTKDVIPAEVLEQLEEIKEKVASGEIVVTDSVFGQN